VPHLNTVTLCSGGVMTGYKINCIDLWQGYKNLVNELIPNAQVVADRFHVMTQVNKELDLQRKREKRKIEDSIKNSPSKLLN
jgi:transposase